MNSTDAGRKSTAQFSSDKQLPRRQTIHSSLQNNLFALTLSPSKFEV